MAPKLYLPVGAGWLGGIEFLMGPSSPAIADLYIVSVHDPADNGFASSPPPEAVDLCLDPGGQGGFLALPPMD